MVEVRNVVHCAARTHCFHFVPVLGGMRVEQHAGEIGGHRVRIPEQRVAARQHKAGSHRIADPSPGTAVPLMCLLERGPERLGSRFLQGRKCGVHVHHRFAGKRAHDIAAEFCAFRKAAIMIPCSRRLKSTYYA